MAGRVVDESKPSIGRQHDREGRVPDAIGNFADDFVSHRIDEYHFVFTPHRDGVLEVVGEHHAAAGPFADDGRAQDDSVPQIDGRHRPVIVVRHESQSPVRRHRRRKGPTSGGVLLEHRPRGGIDVHHLVGALDGNEVSAPVDGTREQRRPVAGGDRFEVRAAERHSDDLVGLESAHEQLRSSAHDGGSQRRVLHRDAPENPGMPPIDDGHHVRPRSRDKRDCSSR